MSNRTHSVIRKAFERLQRQNPKFSIRALATKLGVSHVFMLKLLKGTATLPDKKIPALIKVLSLDELAQAELREALVFDAIKDKLDAFPGLKTKRKLAAETFEEYPAKHFSVLDNWYDLALLDLLTCHQDSGSTLELARALGLTSLEVEASLEKSSRLGLAVFENGKWSKSSSKIRFPTTTPTETTRRYYEQVLERAKAELKKSTPQDFARRSITNLSIAVDPTKVSDAKQKLQQAVYEIAQELASGTPQEVYHLTLALVPLSNSNGN